MTSTGDRIQQLRRSLGLSIRALAKRADVSVAYLSKLEQGDANPTIAILAKIAGALGVSVDDLLESSPPPRLDEPMPASLERFIENYKEAFSELNELDWQRALAGVRLRGKYPDTDNDWLAIFTSMKNALEE